MCFVSSFNVIGYHCNRPLLLLGDDVLCFFIFIAFPPFLLAFIFQELAAITEKKEEYAFWALNEARELASTTPGGHYHRSNGSNGMSLSQEEQEINGRSTQAKVVKKVVLHHLDSTGRAAREKRGSISYSGHDSMGLLKIYHYYYYLF